MEKLKMYLVRKPAQRALNRFSGDRQASPDFGNCCHPAHRFDGVRPSLDIYEDKDNLYIAMELSGLERDDVNVSVDKENVLMIKGEKKQRELAEKEEVIRQERRYGKFERSFNLKSTINSDEIMAEMTDGILKVVLPKFKPKVNEIKIDLVSLSKNSISSKISSGLLNGASSGVFGFLGERSNVSSSMSPNLNVQEFSVSGVVL